MGVGGVIPDRWLRELRRLETGIRLVRGEGAFLWDDEERRYLDLGAGGSAALLGHANPTVNQAISEQLARLTGVSPGFEFDSRHEFIEALSMFMPEPLAGVSFSNSGAEAIEVALTCARLSTERRRFVAVDGAGSGWTLKTSTPDVARVPFDDLGAAERALDKRVAAVVVAPISGEAGMRLPEAGYLIGLAELCHRAGALLIVDEAQTALRTGKPLASLSEGVVPDILCLGSSVANGLPIGVTVIAREIARRLRRSWPESIDAANAVVCAAGAATLRAAGARELQTHARLVGEHLLTRLRALRVPGIREVRGRGLMIAIEMRHNTAAVVQGLQAEGILVGGSSDGVIRVVPALILERRLADQFVDTLAAVIVTTRRARLRGEAATEDSAPEGEEVSLRGMPTAYRLGRSGQNPR